MSAVVGLLVGLLLAVDVNAYATTSYVPVRFKTSNTPVSTICVNSSTGSTTLSNADTFIAGSTRPNGAICTSSVSFYTFAGGVFSPVSSPDAAMLQSWVSPIFSYTPGLDSSSNLVNVTVDTGGTNTYATPAIANQTNSGNASVSYLPIGSFVQGLVAQLLPSPTGGALADAFVQYYNSTYGPSPPGPLGFVIEQKVPSVSTSTSYSTSTSSSTSSTSYSSSSSTTTIVTRILLSGNALLSPDIGGPSGVLYWVHSSVITGGSTYTHSRKLLQSGGTSSTETACAKHYVYEGSCGCYVLTCYP